MELRRIVYSHDPLIAEEERATDNVDGAWAQLMAHSENGRLKSVTLWGRVWVPVLDNDRFKFVLQGFQTGFDRAYRSDTLNAGASVMPGDEEAPATGSQSMEAANAAYMQALQPVPSQPDDIDAKAKSGRGFKIPPPDAAPQ